MRSPVVKKIALVEQATGSGRRGKQHTLHVYYLGIPKKACYNSKKGSTLKVSDLHVHCSC